MGTPDFSRESLDILYQAGHEICGVVTQPDRPSGRKRKVILSPVKEYAIEKNLPLYQPEKIVHNEEFQDIVKKMAPELICVVSYGGILPKTILDVPVHGCINVHPSLLPKYRGSAPIQWAIINGDKTTGVTIMYLNEKMDAGDIIMQEETPIGEEETTGELWKRLSTMGAKLLLESIKQIEQKTVQRKPQGENYTLAPMLNREMTKIQWETQTSIAIKNLTRGFNPMMGTYALLNHKKIKFWKVQAITETDFKNMIQDKEILSYQTAKNGSVLLADEKIGLFIKTKDGIISVIEIQGENAKRMKINDFLRGNKIALGEKFE